MDKILIVDDSTSISQVLRASIIESGAYEVVICQSFKEAQKVLEIESDFLAAVLDLNLEDAPNGEIVEYVVQKSIPSIVLTKCINNELRDKILSYPIVDYVVKNNMNEVRHVLSLINRIKKNPQIKILVVDDSTSYRAYLVSLLKIHCYQVLEAVDGEEAINILNQYKNEIWLVLTDYNMPKINGFELTQLIRKNYTGSKLCIIAISSYTTPKLSATLLKAGANDVLSKPFLVEEFYLRINSNIEMLEYIRLVENLLVNDQLTGLYNRRYLFDTGKKLFNDAKKFKYPLAVAILDVDYFKKVNDNYGHDIGDRALKCLADVMLRHVGKNNIVARFGGEEFCILAIGSNKPAVFFEMLRRDIEAMEIPLKNGKTLKITVSIGLALELKENIDETLWLADKALYQAKHEGRNRVVSSAELKLEERNTDLLRSQPR